MCKTCPTFSSKNLHIIFFAKNKSQTDRLDQKIVTQKFDCTPNTLSSKQCKCRPDSENKSLRRHEQLFLKKDSILNRQEAVQPAVIFFSEYSEGSLHFPSPNSSFSKYTTSFLFNLDVFLKKKLLCKNALLCKVPQDF